MKNSDDFKHGVAEGFARGLATAIGGLIVAAVVVMHVFNHSTHAEKRDYLRRFVAKRGYYQPCQNEGFDWAMGVD